MLRHEWAGSKGMIPQPHRKIGVKQRLSCVLWSEWAYRRPISQPYPNPPPHLPKKKCCYHYLQLLHKEYIMYYSTSLFIYSTHQSWPHASRSWRNIEYLIKNLISPFSMISKVIGHMRNSTYRATNTDLKQPVISLKMWTQGNMTVLTELWNHRQQ